MIMKEVVINLNMFSLHMKDIIVGILGKMLIHPLNFEVVTKTPPKLFYWPIYSINFSHLPN